MLIVKLIVLFVCLINFNKCAVNYCEICSNHTLCLYSVRSPGPNTACKSYDANALLSAQEVDIVLNTINERRNFIAMGHSSFLQQAANMRKIAWSSELATIAQRWVDQCDSTTQPDKEDQCRDLVNAKVGQNIASIFGPTPGRYIKSFVELWFIPILKYRGNVSYYNQSKAHGTDYFTQLIWAETEFVGCGKARFYVTPRNTTVERLVCNFAPKGNIHGKPVYALGYPSTQCSNYMIPDREFPGLCTQLKNKTTSKLMTSLQPVTSVLRILNLSNNSMKQEIDPLRNYLKQINFNSNKTKEQRYQKMRHVFFNNTFSDVRRKPLKTHNFWSIETNNSYSHNNPIEKGHSRISHGYEYNYVPREHEHEPHTHHFYSYNPTQYNNDDFRRYDFTSPTININTGSDLKKYYGDSQCSRKQHTTDKKCIINNCSSNICTRGDKYKIYTKPTTSCLPTICEQIVFTNTNEKSPQFNECPCIKKATTACTPHPKHYCCNVNRHCVNNEGQILCENVKTADTLSSFSGFSPNIQLRSGDQTSKIEISSPVPWILSSSNIYKSFKNFNRRRKYDENYKQVKGIIENPLHLHGSHYYDNYFDSSERKKRESEHEITFKPFWQMEEFNHKKPSELKSIRYTTLGIRKSKKSKRTTNPINTEPITISLKEFFTNNSRRNHITEKYLSFEELMHLRKLTSTDRELDAHRRVANENILKQGTTTAVSTSTATTTSEYTTNTPFIRKKHCTRKLTCTWTVFGITGADGNTINGGSGSFDRGSRTPPGYVEGCSRTSTCTREFMDRNQMASVTEEETSSSDFGSISEDGDYCERRSLNVQRRDTGQKSVIKTNSNHQTLMTYNDSPISSNTVLKIPNSCSCNEEILRTERQKRYIGCRLHSKHASIKNLDRHKQNWKTSFTDLKLKDSFYYSGNITSIDESNIYFIIIVLFIFILN